MYMRAEKKTYYQIIKSTGRNTVKDPDTSTNSMGKFEIHVGMRHICGENSITETLWRNVIDLTNIKDQDNITYCFTGI